MGEWGRDRCAPGDAASMATAVASSADSISCDRSFDTKDGLDKDNTRLATCSVVSCVDGGVDELMMSYSQGANDAMRVTIQTGNGAAQMSID